MATFINDGAAIEGVTDEAFAQAAEAIGCEVAAIRAVASVESAQSGFLDDGRPVILFERHLFHRYTNGAHSSKHPDISWRTGGGYKGGKREYERLEEAMGLDEEAALKSASWGKFQILGSNHRAAGFPTVFEFVEAAKQSEDNHLMAFVNFVKANNLDKALRDRNWVAFARGYNGPAYANNMYDQKMRTRYENLKRIEPKSEQKEKVMASTTGSTRVQKVQSMLTDLGYNPGEIDNSYGPSTKSAIMAFQQNLNLVQAGVIDDFFLGALYAMHFKEMQNAA